MHQLLVVVVEADSQDDAIETARDIIDDDLVGVVYDYAETLDASNRWESFPVACKADTVEGRETIENAWERTLNDLLDHLAEVHYELNQTNDIMSVAEENMLRASMGACSLSTPDLFDYLFDARVGYARPISAPSRFDILIECLDGWVVPVDVHF